jgi:hypothetical protein
VSLLYIIIEDASINLSERKGSKTNLYIYIYASVKTFANPDVPLHIVLIY